MATATTLSRHGLTLPMDRIAEACRTYGVRELAVFGSFLRDDFRPDSDIDFLVTFRDADRGPWGSRLIQLQDELSALTGRPTDLVEREGVERSPNYIRRAHILRSAETIYVPEP